MGQKWAHNNDGNGCHCGHRHRLTETECPVTRWNDIARRIECCQKARVARGLWCAEHEADRYGTPQQAKR